MKSPPRWRATILTSFLLLSLACGADESTTTAGSAGTGDAGSVGDAPSDAVTKGEDGPAPPSDAAPCALPSSGVYATFRATSDVFHAWITSANGISQVIALWRGQSMAKIPVGTLDCTNATYNCGWTWRMKPDTVQFAELTIEVCDGLPSYVEAHCASFANGTYCPWAAELTELRDCRTDPACPIVAR
jgi:hypothetical protein